MIIDFGNDKQGGGGRLPVIESLSINANGTYEAPEGTDGYSPVTVDVKAKVQEVNVTYTSNGVNEIVPDAEFDGISKATVTVDVPEPYLVPLTATENKVYNPQVGEDGFSSVEVNVPAPEIKLQEKSTTVNGSVTPDNGFDGLSKVNVNVPQEGGPDFTGTGYDASEIATLNARQQADIDYAKKIKAEWDPENPNLYPYRNNNKLVYFPKVDISKKTSLEDTFFEDHQLRYVSFEDKPLMVDNLNGTFYNCFQLEKIEPFDTSKVTKLQNTFYGCENLKSLPMFDFSSVTYMYQTFYRCTQITEIPLYNTSKVKTMIGPFVGCNSLKVAPQFDMSSCEDMSSWANSSGIEIVPELDTRNIKDFSNSMSSQYIKKIEGLDMRSAENCYQMFAYDRTLQEVTLRGGIPPTCNTQDMFAYAYGEPKFYLEMPNDWSALLKVLPETFIVIPFGEVPLKIRVMKDGAWLSGAQNLTINGQTFNYDGKGVYTGTFNITREEAGIGVDLMLDGVKIGMVKITSDEQIIEAGDNSSLIASKVGADVLTLVPEGGNPDGWAYDDTVKGLKSAKITGGQTTTLKLNLLGDFDMVWGQDSERDYDYGKLLDGAGNEIVSFQGKGTGPEGQETFTGSTPDGIVQAVYSKDGSGDTGLDAFWIKSITCKVLPPYPEV